MRRRSVAARLALATAGRLARRLNRALLLALTFAALLLALPGTAAAAPGLSCPAANPRTTPVWRNFEAFIGQEYAQGRNMRTLDADVLALAMGHALGRVALAMHDDVQRMQAVACLQRGVELWYLALPGIYGSQSEAEGRRLFQLATQTSWGWNDDLVRQHTGVPARTPAYAVLGVTPPQAQGSGPATPPVHAPIAPPPGPAAGSGEPARGQPVTDLEACRQGRYGSSSVAAAAGLVREAAQKLARTPDCRSTNNYLACREVSGALHRAIQNMADVVAVSRSSVGQGCRYCNLRALGYSAIGRSIDKVSLTLQRKGYREHPGTQWGYHYTQLEKERLCSRQGPDERLSIGPVDKADCPGHCALDAQCRFAYYVARTKTCSWINNQSAPNLAALDSADIWDRDARRWLSKPTPTPTPSPSPSPSPPSGGMAAGYYAVEVTGSGFQKGFGSVHRIEGAHVSIVSVNDTGRGGIKAGRSFDEMVALWRAQAKARSDHACTAAPPLCPCPPEPAIWTQGPNYRLLDGPLPRDELVKRYGCSRRDGNKVCIAWRAEVGLPYSTLPSACRK